MRNRVIVLCCIINIECNKKLVYLKQRVSEKLDIENQNGLWQSIFSDVCSARPIIVNSEVKIHWELNILKKEDII
jgi:hypothetical protein